MPIWHTPDHGRPTPIRYGAWLPSGVDRENTLQTITPAQRRARLARRHRLAAEARSDDVAQIAVAVLGLHATDLASVHISAAVRMVRPDDGAIERALYGDRSVVRMLGMRRTMFVVPAQLAAVVQAACTRDVAARERRRTVKMLQDAGVADDAGDWLAGVEQKTLAALNERGDALSAELSEVVPELAQKVVVGAGTRYPATLTVSSRVLLLLAADGHIVRGRPRGSWTSTQYRWAPMRTWLGEDLATLPDEAARVLLARRWLRQFGPGTVADLTWWTGWTKTQTRKVLAEIVPIEVDLEGQTGIMLADDDEPVDEVEPWAALLPALDPTTMGWTAREWYLGDHRSALFDRNGNAGPTIWWDGRIVGGWAQRADGQIATRLLEDVGTPAETAIAAEAERLAEWLGDKRFTPKFRTPLERELAG